MVYPERTSVPRDTTWGLELSHGRIELLLGPHELSHPRCSTASLDPSPHAEAIGMLQGFPLIILRVGHGSLPLRAHSRRQL